MPKATGPFDVTLVPQWTDEEPNGSTLARRSIEKQYHGDLSAMSIGETMNRGAPSLTITVVPDSGTGELAGLSGTVTIAIADKKHSYDFDYTISSNM